MTTAEQPATQHLPMPRATTAAWLVIPPRAVRMPLATFMPPMSSGLVSMRTRMTALPSLAQTSASSALKTIWPVAAPGLAGRPLAMTLAAFSALGSKVGCRSWSRLLGLDAEEGFLLGDHAFLDQVHRDLDGRRRGALAVAGLEHEQHALLDRELHVLHVAIVLLQLGADGDQFLGQDFFVSTWRQLGRSAAGCGCRPPRPRPGR